MPAPPINVNTEFLFFMERVAISLAIGMMIGLEREWAHKEVGVRTFSIVSLASTLSWQISPKLVARSSYGIYYGPLPLQVNSVAKIQNGVVQNVRDFHVRLREENKVRRRF